MVPEINPGPARVCTHRSASPHKGKKVHTQIHTVHMKNGVGGRFHSGKLGQENAEEQARNRIHRIALGETPAQADQGGSQPGPGAATNIS